MGNSYPVIRIKYADDGQPLSKHTHPACELILIKRGSSQIQIGEKRYDAGAGTLVLIGALEQHELSITSRPYERYFCIFFSTAFGTTGSKPIVCNNF